MKDTTHTHRLIRMVLERVLRVIRRSGWTTARYLGPVGENTERLMEKHS